MVQKSSKAPLPNTVKFGIKELFGRRTIVHHSQFVHYCQIVPYLAVS